MNAEIIDTDYNWKQAASQEGVDYDAVQKSFMDQAYGVVANKAKILFQDPFRLGFEIVHRNEKATKMVGIFAFRVRRELLYAPVFFVNGEIKSADMLYRSDVKRFVPLSEDWCAFLVRGIVEGSGEPVDKSRQRQADAYMDRLAYPQRVKYASEMTWEDNLHGMAEARDTFVKGANDGSIFKEIMAHCADAAPLRKLLPELINENGAPALEKLASLVEDSEGAQRFLMENYTREELETVEGWMAKKAEIVDPEANCIVLNMSLAKAASAEAREEIMDRGYELVDKRPEGATNTVIEEIGDGTIKELSGPCACNVLLDNGSLERAALLTVNSNLLHAPDDSYGCLSAYDTRNKPEMVYFPESKEMKRLEYGAEIFGDELFDQKSGIKHCDATKLSTGKVYCMIDADKMMVSEPFLVQSKDPDGDCTTITVCGRYGDAIKLFYAPDRSISEGRYISDEACFIEVSADVERYNDCDCDGGICNCGGKGIKRLDPKCEKVLMNGAGVDKWMRSAGGLTTSTEMYIKCNERGNFDITRKEDGQVTKYARDLGMLEAHLAIAEDFCLTTSAAGEILNKAVDKDVAYRIFDTMSKSGYLTRQEGMEDWIQSYDPELQVKLDAPQRQTLSTWTPERQRQQQRYGDTYNRGQGGGMDGKNPESLEDLGLPADAIFNSSPEQLAQMSQAYDLPHIFDHGCMSQMATTSFNVIEQIKQYIPDLEAGVDRLYRILFLLRYRPADFEEAYGKDALMEMEQELSELANQSGENLLRLLKRFDIDQYSAQDN